MVWVERTAELKEQIHNSWLALLQEAEKVHDDDPRRLWTVAKCCHELGWYKRAEETLDRLSGPEFEAVEVLVAKLRFEMNPSDENARRATQLVMKHRT